MTFFTASFQTVVIRFYLMMAVVIASFSFGYPLLAIFSLPIFLSAMTAISFTKPKKAVQAIQKETKEITLVNTAA